MTDSTQPNPPRTLQNARDEQSVRQLQRAIKRWQQQQDIARERRRRKTLYMGIAVSLIAHVLLLAYFGMLTRLGPGGGGPPAREVEFALVFDESLTEMPEHDLAALDADDAALEALSIDEPEITLDADATGDLTIASDMALDSVGGAGESFSSGLSGGGAGTTYFGIAAEGTRIAYIFDRSGSMTMNHRMVIARAELIRSIEALPDYASFYIVLFSSETLEPPTQRGWVQARPVNVNRVVHWLNQVDPGGGTVPGPAFRQILSLDARPDVIFFMTDGIIHGFSASEVNAMNRNGQRVVIHTISFGDQGSEELLRQIARDSGGTYRYVPDRSQ